VFLQRNYFLPNYNLEQAAVVIVPTIRVSAVLDAVGPRGYNVVNATIGAVAQNVYTAAAALDIGGGVALGFDGVSYVEELGLDATGETPLLIMLVPHSRGSRATTAPSGYPLRGTGRRPAVRHGGSVAMPGGGQARRRVARLRSRAAR
jgi:hypothetical protein